MAETETKKTDTSFLDEKGGTKIHIKDVLFIVLRNLHWLILFAVAGALVAYFNVHQQNRVYQSTARVLIKGSSTGGNDGAVREANVRNMFNTRSLYNSNINNEMMILTSKSAITEVVQNLKLAVTYTQKTRIVNRVKDLYGECPVEVSFIDDNEEDWFSFDVTPIDSVTVTANIAGYEPLQINLGDTVATPLGCRIVIAKTWFYTPGVYNNSITVTHRSLNATVDYYRYALQVSRDDDFNSIVNITLQDPSPIRAADVINEAIRVYNDDAIRDKKRIIAYTYDYINERLQLLHSDLGIEESALANFKRENQLLNISEYGQSYLATSIQSSEEVERLKKQLSTARYLMQLNESSSKAHPIPLNIGLSEEHIMALIEQHNTLVLELEKYESQNNPVVKQKMAELGNIRSNMNTLLDVYIGVLQERISEAQMAANVASNKMSQVPQQQIYIENLERTQKIKEDLYLHLLSRREELMISQPSIEPNGKILDQARVNRNPIAPNEKQTTLMGLLIGLLIPVASFFLRRLLDTKVKYYTDVIKVTSAPFLCEIPARAKDDDREVVVTSHDHDAMSESFRLLRAKVDFLVKNSDDQSRVIMVTSLLPGMGKTFISTNLASSLGIAGKRIIIIDLDLRRGSLTRNFYSRRHAGLSNYLIGKTNDWKSLVKHDLITTGVDCIFTGPIPPNPTELLGNGRLPALLAELRKEYEYIVFDTAPTGLVVDTDIIKPLVDNTLFVIRSGKFDKRMLEEVETLYTGHTFPNIAILLNDVHYRKLTSFERKYGYGYGYGYG